MEQMKAQFKDSWQELKHLKTIVVTAMFIAIGVVLGFFFTIQVTDFLKIGFSFIANEMTALLFGPVVGGIMGGVTDIIKFVLKPTGAYFFGFTFNAILGAVIYGMILYHRPISLKRILIAKIIVAIIVNLLLGTYWLHIMYGKAFCQFFFINIVNLFYNKTYRLPFFHTCLLPFIFLFSLTQKFLPLTGLSPQYRKENFQSVQT